MTREEAIKILKEERWYMSRYSEEYKEAYDIAIEALSADYVSRKDTVTLNSPISIQAEMVAVVRCKDCMWNIYDEDSIYCLRLSCGHHGHTIQIVEEDFFCKYGERKEDTESALYYGYGENWKEFKNKACEEAIKAIKERDD